MKKLRLIYRYCVYRLKAVNEHGVHSPFVFDLLLQVIYNKTNYYSYKKVEAVRTKMRSSMQVVNCIDLGAGSRHSKTGHAVSAKRTVKELATYAAKPVKYSQLLFRLVNYFQPANVIELGTSLGISGIYMASANSRTNVITIEGCPEIAAVAIQNFEQLELRNVEQLVGNFDEVLPSVLTKLELVDLVFFDGNHRKEPTLRYFEQCLQKAHEGSVFVFDDINWSEEMIEAWELIKKNERVTVTIDLFFMGIVFFRKEQVKQHFMIKF